MKNKHEVLERLGRYALIKTQSEISQYVVCGGYCDKTGEWGAGFYFATLQDAMTDYTERTSRCCRNCVNAHAENHPTWCMR